MSHFYVSFKITLGTDYRLRLQMLCRRQEEEPDNGPISKMSMYFFFFSPLLLYVNPSLLSNSPVVVDPVVGVRRFDYRYVSRGVMKQCESQR